MKKRRVSEHPLFFLFCGHFWTSASRHRFVCRRKETAALKIKAAVSNGRVKLSALRRLFFFCRRPAECYSIFNSMLPVKLSHSIPI